MYFCWECGKQATKTNIRERFVFDKSAVTIEKEPSEWSRCYCDECLFKLRKRDKEEKELYIKLKKREMFKKACDILENQHTKMYEWKEAIDTVCEHIENNPDKYDSSYEVLAAMLDKKAKQLPKAIFSILELREKQRQPV